MGIIKQILNSECNLLLDLESINNKLNSSEDFVIDSAMMNSVDSLIYCIVKRSFVHKENSSYYCVLRGFIANPSTSSTSLERYIPAEDCKVKFNSLEFLWYNGYNLQSDRNYAG